MQELTNYPTSFKWYLKLGCGITSLAEVQSFPTITINTGFCLRRPKTPIWRFLQSSAKNLEFLPSKFQCKKWPAILPLCVDMWNLAVVWPVWLLCIISQNWQKRTGFCKRRLYAPILSTFGGQVQKIANMFPKSFNAKTDWLSFIFVMIRKTWPWHYWFCCGV